ncbi:MAG: response regulator transcription factor [Candidatus Gastranaerophilales bacterium]|nr:response regulator transcription factor [Candidatus Gastranaerophilales bacterium]
MMKNSKLLILNSLDKDLLQILGLNYVLFEQDFDLEFDFKSIEFDLIIVNLQSEAELNIIKYFRENPEFDFIPIVCLINEDSIDLNLELIRLGCDECLKTPVNTEEFNVKISSILKRYKEIWKSSLNSLLPHLMNNNPDLKLTKREKDLLHLIAKGFTNAEISKTLYLSEMTVKTHLKNIFKKLNVSNRTEATLIGIINDLIKV